MLWIAGLYHRHAHPFHKESIFQSVIFIVFCLLGSVYFKLVGYDLTKIFRFFIHFSTSDVETAFVKKKFFGNLGGMDAAQVCILCIGNGRQKTSIKYCMKIV